MKFWKGFKSKKNNHDTNNPKEVIVPDPQSQSNASPDPAMGMIFEGLELAKQGNYDESELRYYEVTAIDPNYSAVWYADHPFRIIQMDWMNCYPRVLRSAHPYTTK